MFRTCQTCGVASSKHDHKYFSQVENVTEDRKQVNKLSKTYHILSRVQAARDPLNFVQMTESVPMCPNLKGFIDSKFKWIRLSRATYCLW